MNCTFCNKPIGDIPSRGGMHAGCVFMSTFDSINQDGELIFYGYVEDIKTIGSKRVGTCDGKNVWQPDTISSSRAWEVGV